MSLFIGPMRQHVHGYKDLSDHKAVVNVSAGKQVFIPLYAGHSLNFEVLVKEGDRVFVGTKIAICNDRFIVPIYASVSGTFTGIQKIMHASLKPCDHVVIENDGKMEKVSAFEPLDYQSASREELVDFMMNAGIIGCGGAGFPTYMKYKGVKDVKNVIIDAIECEPYITSDYRMILDNLSDMCVGALAMKKAAQAEEVIIAIKKSHPELIKAVHDAVVSIPGLRVVGVADVYPMGWERVLVRTIMKKEYVRLPIEVGAIVNSATTAIALGKALLNGEPIIEKMVTVSGDAIQEPANVRVPVGVPANEVIKACGGYTSEDIKLIAGGPMMGKTIVNDQFVIDRTSDSLTVLINHPFESISCLRCGKCSDNCSAGLQPVRIAQAVKLGDKKAMEKLCAMDCIECGLCTYVCPSRLDVTESVRKAKRQLALAKK